MGLMVQPLRTIPRELRCGLRQLLGNRATGQQPEALMRISERVVGTGSFGIVFQAKCLETGETVAIKKVLQDKRYKNRELQLMRSMDHPNVISLKHCFFSTTNRDELFLNLVMEYVPETLYRVLKHYSNVNQRMPLINVKLYMCQIFRGLAYIHTVPGVCHRDVKPQNLLVCTLPALYEKSKLLFVADMLRFSPYYINPVQVDPLTHQVKLCDFGSAKILGFLHCHLSMPSAFPVLIVGSP